MQMELDEQAQACGVTPDSLDIYGKSFAECHAGCFLLCGVDPSP